MPLFDPDAYRTHAHHVVAEMLKLTQEERSFRTESYKADIFAEDPVQVIEVKSVREELMHATINAAQFHKHLAEYEELVFALWTNRGRLELTPGELLERSEEYRGSKVRPGKNGAGPYYLFNVSSDTFADPFVNRRLRGPDSLEDNLQLAFDGRAVRKPALWTPGPVQAEVLKGLIYCGGMAAWEVGVVIHALRGECPSYPSRRLLTRQLRPGECCVAAVDDGSSLITTLRDQGRVWKDEQSGLWSLYPEKEWALA